MSEVKLSAEVRTEFGKGAARRIRREDKIPAVIYGHGAEPSDDGKTVFVSYWDSGFVRLDLTDPASPQEVGFYQNDGEFSPWAAYWDGNRIWTADEHADNGGVEVFDFKP